MFFYFSTNMAVRVEGGVWRHEQCQECGKGYRYYVKKAVTRSRQAPYNLNKSGAERAARKAAEKALAKRFDTEVEPVPCPTCGGYQAAMVPAVFAERFRWVSRAFTAALCLAAILFAVAGMLVYELLGMANRKDQFSKDWFVISVLVPAFCVAVLPLILLKVYQRQQAALFHPNLDIPQEERLALGRQLAELAADETLTHEA